MRECEHATTDECDGDVEHPALAAGDLAEHGEGDHGHAAEQLVGRTKERPDVQVATEAEDEADEQGDRGGEPDVGHDLADAGDLLGGLGGGVI